ncbi:hemerythrin HHE cation binding domain-containing protein [Phialemonium atrogriseum]|uniref:Hemerythrin HHE cation binding domain-containing protein n=1 Tax=Phialemonium atrogriseum TaxID=1093897 RepID=A0AAJ0FKS7_9PEZI|nr:hemerythrin HHE cation binding domain-containing protein [Phialemonium atrogriseum]KAK1764385.1 hemerythrin HHE cation binding domain-containing protein [Phialemonium atrogriseum]
MAPTYADHPFPLIPTPVFLKGKDAKIDFFDRCASEMACVHNMVSRGLNAIYLQAPHIQAKDEKAFCTFITHWYNLLHLHHAGEEEDFFPTIEKMAGEKGIMEHNVDQHHAFLGGFEALGSYAKACAAGDQKYDGRKVVEMIDGFGSELSQHLADEIPTIEGLRRFGEEKMAGLTAVLDREGERNQKNLGIMGLCACYAMLDIHYEDDLWINWPPAPGVVKFVCRNVVWRLNADMLKFGAVDKDGKMKPLYAVPQETEGTA